MKITKSNSTKQSFNPNKILKRVEDQSKNLNVNPTIVAQKVIAGVMDDMETKDITNLYTEKDRTQTTGSKNKNYKN